MEEKKTTDTAENEKQQLCRLALEMDDLIKNLHNLQIEMKEIQKEYAAFP